MNKPDMDVLIENMLDSLEQMGADRSRLSVKQDGDKVEIIDINSGEVVCAIAAPRDGETHEQAMNRCFPDRGPLDIAMSHDSKSGKVTVHGKRYDIGERPEHLDHVGRIERKVKLPHGFTVTYIWDQVLNTQWHPAYPSFKKPAVERKFWSRYYKARNEFCQDIADATGENLYIEGSDGVNAFSPTQDATRH